MADYATKLAEAFSKKLILEGYDNSLLEVIVNRDYEGEINAVGSKLNMLNFDRISEKTYTGADLGTPDDITENNAQLIIDQYKSFYPRIFTIDKWLSYIKDPKPTIVTQMANERNRNIDLFALALYGDVAAGNRVGTDADDATTITITATTGAFVVAGGTPVASTWVGRGIKAVGHTKWYRVKSQSSTTEGFVENDEDDVDSHYDGGLLSGVSYVVEAITPVAITTSNLLDKVAEMKLKLDIADRDEKSTVPDTDRWLIVPPEFEQILIKASGIALHVPAVYEELVKRGFITELQGFKVFKSNRLSGDNTDGFRMLAGHPGWCTFADKVLEVGMEDLIGNFGKAYKDLFVYGAKVNDKRRHYASEMYCTFS